MANWLLTAGVRLIIAVALLIISFRVINLIGRKIEGASERGRLDKTLSRVLAYVFKIGAKLIVAICLVGYVGIDTSGLAALVASVGVGAGLALNGALSNLAGGVLLILTRPFKVDDFIEAQGYTGTVEDIHIVCTKLKTPDNKVVYIPNGALSSGNIVNFSEKDIRRVDINFSIGYSDDFEKAKQLILDLITSHKKVLSDPAPLVRVSEHGASGVNIVARAWVRSSDYWDVHFDLLESVKLEFDNQGIEIPYNQLDVHLKNG